MHNDLDVREGYTQNKPCICSERDGIIEKLLRLNNVCYVLH